MSRYRLIYLDIKGRAEVSRMLFKVTGVDFEDVRIPWNPEAIAPYKKYAPFGRFPVLQFGSKTICQSHAIERYLAREFGLQGDTSWEQARADMVVSCLEETIAPLEGIALTRDKDLKKIMAEKHVAKTLPRHLDYFHDILKENNGGNGFFVGSNMTYADVAFSLYIQWPHAVCQPSSQLDLGPWPRLKDLVSRVESQPAIAAWIRDRPKTPM